jgi:hypothetical protein
MKIKKTLIGIVLILIVLVPILSGCSLRKYQVVLSSENQLRGFVYGSGTYASGELVTIVAMPKDIYEFDKWSDNNTDNHLYTLLCNKN